MAHLAQVLPAFLLACLVIAALPGPATALFIHRSVRDGRSAGLAAVVGNEIGVSCWTLAGGAGLSVLLLANRVLSLALHVVGAVVLVWMGITAWRRAGHAIDEDSAGRGRGRTPGAAFRASLVSIAANPKAAVFGIAVLPQFLPDGSARWPTLLVLAGIQLVIDTSWCVGVVLLAARARTALSRVRVRRSVEKSMGALLVALGIGLVADAR